MDRGRRQARRAALSGWLLALEASGPARLLATASGLYPIVSALHVLAIGLVLAPVLVVDARLLGVLRDARLDAALPALLRLARRAFALAALSGALLFTVQATDYAANPAFRLKLALLALAGLNAWTLHRWVPETVLSSSAHARVAAGASLALWLGVLLCGRWIAFV